MADGRIEVDLSEVGAEGEELSWGLGYGGFVDVLWEGVGGEVLVGWELSGGVDDVYEVEVGIAHVEEGEVEIHGEGWVELWKCKVVGVERWNRGDVRRDGWEGWEGWCSLCGNDIWLVFLSIGFSVFSGVNLNMCSFSRPSHGFLRRVDAFDAFALASSASIDFFGTGELSASCRESEDYPQSKIIKGGIRHSSQARRFGCSPALRAVFVLIFCGSQSVAYRYVSTDG